MKENYRLILETMILKHLFLLYVTLLYVNIKIKLWFKTYKKHLRNENQNEEVGEAVKFKIRTLN